MGMVTHRAKWVMITPKEIIENGYVTVGNGRIAASGRGKGPKGTPVEDHGTGMLMPALINAHTHLDLTLIEGAIPMEPGFLSWVQAVITSRAALTDNKIVNGIRKGQELLRESGCILTGDHRSFSLEASSSAKPFVHVFYEYLGSEFPPLLPESNGEPSSLAAHAPHTTGPGLIRRLKQWCRERNLVFSMHVAESPEEAEFITSARGKWADFLASRSISFEGWNLPAPSSVRHLDCLGVLDDETLAVHLVQADRNDLEILEERGVRVCLCPRSNRNLLDQLPDVRAMLDRGLRPALGTDSLASVSSLDLFEEMRFLAREVPGLSPTEIIAMGSVNGARALGVEEELGTLETGKHGAMLFLPVDGTTSEAVITNLLSEDFQIPPEWVL